MPKLVLLRLQVLAVIVVRFYLERNPLDDLDSIAFDAGTLAGIVRDEPHVSNSQIHQDLGSDPVITLVRREPQSVTAIGSPKSGFMSGW